MFAERRQKMRDAMGPDAVAIFIGAKLATRSNDTQYLFRQDSDFWYLTGFDYPNAIAVLRTDDGPPFSLFVEPRDRAAETWTGTRPGVEGAVSDHGADSAYRCDEFPHELEALVRSAKSIHHVVGRSEEIDRILFSSLESLRQKSREGIEPAATITDPRAVLHEMRLFKSADEIEIMRRAAAISLEAHGEVAKLVRADAYEYELEAALAHTFRQRGGSGPAYNIIVATGSNATTLHYIINNQPLRAGELVLIDAGVELEGYASDVTRTYPVGGKFEGPGRDLYELVLAAQQAAFVSCHPRMTLPEIHEKTLRVLVEGMVGLNLLSGSVDDLIASESYRDYYMHGTSHWLGLDVHDVGRYRVDGKARNLEPGMCFTIEPGLYIPSDAESAPEALRGIGVRIEDNVVITQDGFENLTSAIPKKPDELEAWMQ